jgi:hypothetical protein
MLRLAALHVPSPFGDSIMRLASRFPREGGRAGLFENKLFEN